MSSEAALEQIRRAADIVEVISSVVPLKKLGAYFRAPCPFHKDSNPSFTVNPTTQTFYCFGCQEGGDVFSFYMKYHNLGFPETVRELAAKFGVSLSRDWGARSRDPKEDALKERLYELNEQAAAYYHRTLLHPERGGKALEYLKRRGIDTEIIRKFRLGYAPAGWTNLINFFRGKRVSVKDCETAGLVIPGKNGSHYDRFRDRIIFPIMDTRHRVMGLGGRVLDQSLPKYLNSPETPIYHKGRVLYGLHTGLDEGRRAGKTLLVEGYMDLLALYAHGVGNVLASLGTALTRDQVRLMKRTGGAVVVAFDSDEAGRKAAFKAAPLLLEEGVASYAVQFASGEDPDDYVRREGGDAVRTLLDEAPPLVDFCLDWILRKPVRTASDKESALTEAAPLVRAIPSEIVRLEAVRKLSSALHLDEGIVSRTVQSSSKASLKELPKGLVHDVTVRMEEHLLGFLLRNPGFIPTFIKDECVAEFESEHIKSLAVSLFEIFEDSGTSDTAVLFSRCSEPRMQSFIARLLTEEHPEEAENAEKIALDFSRTYRRRRLRRREERLTQRIQEAEQTNNIDLLRSLLREQQELVSLRTQTI